MVDMKSSLKLCDCVNCGGELPASLCIRDSQELLLKSYTKNRRKAQFYGVLTLTFVALLFFSAFF